MQQLMGQTLFAFTMTVTAILLLRRAAAKLGLVDHPGGRKCHARPIPLVGGVAMFIGLVGVILFNATLFPAELPLLLAATLMVLVGVADDRFDLAATPRLLLQLAASALVVVLGESVVLSLGHLLGGDAIALGWFAMPFTVVALVGVINAFNMADGSDGLAGGLALVAILWLILATVIGNGDHISLQLLLLLAAVVSAFLIFNLRSPWRHRAAIFMGDGGSMLLGLLLGVMVIRLSQGSAGPAVITPITAVWILGLPLIDTVCIMVRRMRRGRSPFAADREHLHHILQLAGFSDARTVALLLLASALLGGIGLSAQWAGVPEGILFAAFLLLTIGYYRAMSRAWRLMKVIRQLNSPIDEPPPSDGGGGGARPTAATRDSGNTTPFTPSRSGSFSYTAPGGSHNRSQRARARLAARRIRQRIAQQR